MKRNYVWFLFLSLIWPLVQLLIFGLRFQRLPDNMWESVYFLPMGIVSATFLLFMMGKTVERTTRVSTAVGYLVACPIALVGGLGGGLFLFFFLVVKLFSYLQLVLGMDAGYGMGKLVTPGVGNSQPKNG